MGMKNCRKCKVELIVDKNITIKAYNNSDYECKPCANNRWQEYRRGKGKSIVKKSLDKWYTKDNDGYFYVYLLPDYNYVGQTQNVPMRMQTQYNKWGRNTNNFEILHKCNTRQEALVIELKYHDLGYEGKSGRHNKS